MDNNLIDQVYEELIRQGYQVYKTQIHKNNMETIALSVSLDNGNDTQVTPVIYAEMLADMYQPGGSIADLAERVIAFTKEHYDMKAIDFGKLKDRDYILTHATLAICNTHGNEKMLAPLVHEQVPGTDLTVYPCINIGHGSAKAVREYIESLGIQPSEILASAALNSRKEYTVRKMRDVMAEMMGIAPEAVPDMNMVAVSNQEGVNGAAAISDPETMDMVTELLKAEEFCIIPSSIHEIICIPSETADEYTIQSIINHNLR